MMSRLLKDAFKTECRKMKEMKTTFSKRLLSHAMLLSVMDEPGKQFIIIFNSYIQKRLFMYALLMKLQISVRYFEFLS